MAAHVSLTREQQDAILALLSGVKSGRHIQTLGGYAGTGKTTIIANLLETIPDLFPNLTTAVCAFTGKAANVLRRKGVLSASTIHSLIYEAKRNPDTQVVEFILRDGLPCDLIIVDEASMVSKEIYDDLTSFGLPTIFVGDHGQLEPVGSDFYLMREPDYRLEKIHRNAGEISHFAEWLRKGHKSTHFPGRHGKVEFLRKWEVDEQELWTGADQIICAYNKTRVLTNDHVRNKLGRKEKLEVGDRVMCLRNHRDFGIFNGMQGVVTRLYKSRLTKNGRRLLDFDSYGDVICGIPYQPAQFGQEKTIQCDSKDDPIPFDYAYCITAHKSQGDEFNNVMVFEQFCKNWDHRRWAYTAASRAKEKLYWVTGM